MVRVNLDLVRGILDVACRVPQSERWCACCVPRFFFVFFFVSFWFCVVLCSLFSPLSGGCTLMLFISISISILTCYFPCRALIVINRAGLDLQG